MSVDATYGALTFTEPSVAVTLIFSVESKSIIPSSSLIDTYFTDVVPGALALNFIFTVMSFWACEAFET